MNEQKPAKGSAERTLEHSAAFLIGTIANKYVLTSSAVLRKLEGIGFTEWRVLLMLALEPGVSAKYISDVTGVDKAAISRSVKTLAAGRLIEPTPTTSERWSKHYRLAKAGQSMVDRMMPWFVQVDRVLLGRLDPADRLALVALLQKVFEQLPDVMQSANHPLRPVDDTIEAAS